MNEAQLLHAAAFAVISDRDRWTQGSFARRANYRSTPSKSKAAVCWCSRGALEVVSCKGLHRYDGYVEDALHEAAKKLGEIEGYVRFNDTHTHEEVITMWQLAGEILATQ